MRGAVITFLVAVTGHRYFIVGEPVPTPKPYVLPGTVASTIPANTFYFTDAVEYEKNFRLQLPGSTYAAIDEEHSVHKVRPKGEWFEKITYDRWAPEGYQTLSHMKTLEVPQISRGIATTPPFTVTPDYRTHTLVTGLTWSSTPRIPYQSFWSATFTHLVPLPKLTTPMPERLLVDRTEAEASRLNGELPIKGVIKRLKDDVELLEEIAMRPGVLDEVKSDAGISTTPEPAGHMAPTALTTPAAKAADESTSFVLTPGEDFTYRTVNVEALWPLINRTHKTERLSEDEKLFRDDIIALHAWHGDDVTRRASPTTQIETPLPRERLQQLMSLPSRTTAPISRSVQQLKTETPSVSLGPAWAVRMPQPRQSGEARLRVTPVRSTTLPSRLPVYKHKVENSDIDTDGVALGGVWRVSETDSRIGNTQVDHFSTVPLPLGSTTKRPTAPFMSNARLRFHHQRHKV